MEMVHRSDGRDDYAFISGSTRQPWYSRYKRKICGISIAALVICIIVILVATSRSKKSTADLIDLYSLKWEGNCPWEPEQCPESFQGQPPLILVSIDGFRADYIDRGFNPVLHKISQCGVSTEAMYSVFPTKTFPNHFTQVTGLYPSSHGVVDNTMRDSGKFFKVSSGGIDDPFWWEKEPIWVSAVKQGLKTATFFWPGSDVEINGTYPTYYKKFNSKTPFEERVDQVLDWLDLPVESRPSFFTLYFNEPDTAAHEFGTDSKEVDAAMVRVDSMVERLFAGLQLRNLTGCVNVIMVSDHGMTNVNCSNVIDLERYVNVSTVDTITGTFGRLQPKDQNTTVDSLVSELQCKDIHMRVFKKEEFPIRMHYSDHRRIEPILLEMDGGWTLVTEEVKSKKYSCTGAAHGYDNLNPDMRAFFTAIGPSLKNNFTIEPFLNIELYELMCEMINITANPNNGTRGSMHHLLRQPKILAPEKESEPLVIAELPDNDAEYEAREVAANCECNQTRKQMNVANITEKKDYHLPFGIPGSDENHLSRLLYNNDYILAYHIEISMPLWASFTLDNETSLTKEEICWKGDARITTDYNIQCTDYKALNLRKVDVIQRPLYFAGFSNPLYKEEMEYITNSIPKAHDLEDELIPLLKEWTHTDSLFNIVIGPAFDLLGTGIRPSAEIFRKEQEQYGRLIVPTHLFMIATWCSQDVDQLVDCQPSDLDTLAFLLPNHPYPQNWNCETPKFAISKNVARVVDVETLTGLSFFTGLPLYDAIRLRTKMPQLHT